MDSTLSLPIKVCAKDRKAHDRIVQLGLFDKNKK
jgi:hypothetical protein